MIDPDSNDPPAARRPEIPEEKIAGLLRLTGPRPSVPEERTRRVKAAVRARWRTQIHARPRRRIWALGAVAAAAAIVVIVAIEWRSRGGMHPTRVPMPLVVAVSGPATIHPTPGSTDSTGGGLPREVQAGQEVPAGWWIETGPEGRVALRTSSDASLRLDVGTRAEVLSGRSLTLWAGAVYVDAGSRGQPVPPEDGPIEIHTPAGRVREAGTQFEVRLIDAAVRLRVREGLVTVDRPSGRLEAGSGQELRVDADGTTGIRDLPIHGEEWAWMEEIVPMMEIEGRSLRDFLDWMARERGLRIRLESGELGAAAAGIRLQGSIREMTLDQALESVLLTCRMHHRIEGDLLVVESLDGPSRSS